MQIKKYIYYVNQGIINVAPCVNWCAYYRMVDSDTEIFEYLPAIFLFSISPAVFNQKYFKTSLSLYYVFHYDNWIWKCKISQKYII